MLVLASDGDGVTRTTNVVAASSDYTCVVWHWLAGGLNAGYVNAFATWDDGVFSTFAQIKSDVADIPYGLYTDNGSSAATTTKDNSFEDWTHYAYVREGTAQRFYVNGVLIGTSTLDLSAATFDIVRLGFDGTSTDAGTRFAQFREWDAALPVADIIAEAQSTSAVRTADLVTDTPLATDLLDDSGNGNDWTAVGGATTSAQSFPYFVSSALAKPIAALPFTDSVVNPADNRLWYSYVPPSSVKAIGVYGLGVVPSYGIRATTFRSPDLVTNWTGEAAANVPIQVPVLAGETFFLRFRVSVGTAGTVTVSVLAGNNQTVPVGAILVNEAGSAPDQFPLVALSSQDGDDHHVYNFYHPFPTGEAADSLSDGRMLFSDRFATNCKIYNGSFTEVASVAIDIGLNRTIRTCRGNDVWFVGQDGTPARVYTVTGAGAIGATTWDLTGTTAIGLLAPNTNGTIAYYADDNANAAIRRWDLVADAALSDFLPTKGANEYPIDALVLEDDTVVLAYYNDSTGDANVYHYSAAGVLLRTFALGLTRLASLLAVRLAYALNSPTSFWVWFHQTTTGLQTFRNYRVSDGVTLAEVEGVEYATGINQMAAQTTPVARFGASFSCPFLIYRGASGSEPTFDISTETRPIRRLRQTPHVSANGNRLFHNRLQIDMRVGVGLPSGQGSDPKVMLQVSRDGGMTWGVERFASAGAIGQYLTRVQFYRQGVGRDVVYRVVVSDPVAWQIVGAYLELEEGLN